MAFLNQRMDCAVAVLAMIATTQKRQNEYAKTQSLVPAMGKKGCGVKGVCVGQSLMPV